jgi:D-glycero-D-manno-heptose 1,7-bisphosphate phosphatase
LLIIVTNQSGVAKGLYKQEDVELVHGYLLNEFTKNNITISEVYYCLHHPDVSNCICRKPGSLFVEKALARFHIDPAKSYFIGDKERDTEAGEKAGVKGILIEANSPLKNIVGQIE